MLILVEWRQRTSLKCLLNSVISTAVYLNEGWSKFTFYIITYCATPLDCKQRDEETNDETRNQNETLKYLRWCHAYQSTSDKVWQLSRYFQYKQAAGQSLSIRPMMTTVKLLRGYKRVCLTVTHCLFEDTYPVFACFPAFSVCSQIYNLWTTTDNEWADVILNSLQIGWYFKTILRPKHQPQQEHTGLPGTYTTDLPVFFFFYQMETKLLFCVLLTALSQDLSAVWLRAATIQPVWHSFKTTRPKTWQGLLLFLNFQ